MKCKRILSMLLTLCMVMSLFAGTTVTASAASVTTRTIPLDVTTIRNITDTNGNSITPTTDSEGNQIYKCESEGWSYRLNSSKQIFELTLSGVNFDIKNTDLGWAIIAPKVILADGTENRVSTVSSNKTVAAINTQEITGSGSLTVSATGTSAGASCYGIYTNTQNLTLDQCSIVVDGVTCTNGSATGIFAASSKILTITANTAKDNKITIKNVQGNTTKALGSTRKIVAEGAFVSGARDSFTSGSTKSIYFQDSNVPVIVSFAAPSPEPEAATFTDGFGNTIENAATYEKGTTKNDKDYIFAGWFNGDGDELTDVANAVAGTTYTAKWTKNGKTVRTAVLDLTVISESNTFGATLTDGVYTNADEGWSWNTATNTLTLSGCNFNIVDTTGTNGFMAIKLPAKSTINLASKTENIVVSSSTKQSGAIGAATSLTIEGDGTLGITSSFTGIMAGGNIAINSPITVKSTSNEEYAMAIAIESENEDDTITIADTLEITKPVGGKIHSSGKTILDSNGGVAKEVVISAKGGSTETPTFNDGFGKTIENATSYEKGTTTNDKGYTFAGWFDGETELENTDAAVAGTTYTAKWTKNGKTVRTTALDFSNNASDEWKTGCTQNGTLWTNDAEGWSWDTNTKTLSLSGVTIDIPETNKDASVAVCLPHGGTVKSDAGTQNTICNRSGIEGDAIGLKGFGVITIDGSGELSITGKTYGIISSKLTIKAPLLTATAINEEGVAVACSQIGSASDVLTLDSSVSITKPAGGKVCKDDWRAVIGDSNGTPAKEVVIGIAKKYTVTYNTNGGSAVESATVSEGSKLTEPTAAPTKDGYTFLGWYKDAAFTNRWNFDADTVTGNITLYAKWAETAKTYGISGTVYESNGTTTASGVTVKLMKGNTQVASTTSATDGTGKYSFTGIAPGVYNIVAEKDDTTQTTLVIVTNHDETGKNVTLPQSKVNSKLTVKGDDTPDVVAGGLDKEAAAVKGANSTATSVKVEMTVESKSSAAVDPTDKTNIGTVASGKTLEYLDIKVIKTVDGNEDAITKTENMMEIVIPYDMTGKSNITVYRNHNDSATAFRQLSTLPGSGAVDGTYYLDTVNHLIYVYAQKFSTYAIGYNTQSGGGSGSGGSSSGGGSSSSSGGSSSGNSSTISTPSAKNGTVSVSPKSASKGTTVTVTVTPDKGYVLETLTVTDASGKKLDLKNLGSGKYSFTMPASKVEVKATFMEDNTMLNYFVDVPASAYYYDAVLWAAEQGITGGTDATHFSPDGVCTRAQAVTFLWRAAGSPAPSATAMPFTDVAADSYYYNAVLWAMENGITVGTSSTTFSPDLKCSRAHIMTFLWRSEKSPAAGSVNPFTDVSADAYYADAVLWAVKESVTNGTSSATFSPDADCTRAQIVTFIWRTLTR